MEQRENYPENLIEKIMKEIGFALTVCSKNGTIIYMNDMSADVFEKDGGRAILGSDVLGCHPEPSRTMLKEMLKTGKQNIYTIEKNGVKKIIIQIPYSLGGKYEGFAEISTEIPLEMKHFIRGQE